MITLATVTNMTSLSYEHLVIIAQTYELAVTVKLKVHATSDSIHSVGLSMLSESKPFKPSFVERFHGKGNSLPGNSSTHIKLRESSYATYRWR